MSIEVGLLLFVIALIMLLIVSIIKRREIGALSKAIIPLVSLFIIITSVFLVFNIGREENKKKEEEEHYMDMIMWYDIDIGPNSNDRPDKGWWYLNPQHPNTVRVQGHYRTTTPLLGLYDQRKVETARQHLYWISALGCNVIACDWTNYTSYRKAENPSWIQYTKGVYLNTEVLLKTALDSKDFTPSKIYTTLRLFGEDYDGLREVLDDVYNLYEDYSDGWYKFYDSDKPFIVIFVDRDVRANFKEEGFPNVDERFNIRWSNGYLGGDDSLAIDHGYWLFTEDKLEDTEKELYKSFYAKGKDGGVEQMIGWASVYKGYSNWDPMNRIVDGKTTFERTIWDIKRLKPKAVLINRFNYALAWKEEAQEGLSLLESTHIEPCVDLGFLIFDNVKENIYELNNLEKKKAQADILEVKDGRLRVSLDSFPTEYRLSKGEGMEGAEWEYLNINEWIDFGDELYLQLRNVFGTSQIVEIGG